MKCYFKALSREALLQDFTALQMTSGEDFLSTDQYTVEYRGEAPGDPGNHYLSVETNDSAFMYDLIAKAFFAGTQRVTSNPNFGDYSTEEVLQGIDLGQHKLKACNSIDATASRIRQEVASPYPDQYFVYTSKEAQAREFQADPSPTPEKYPYVYGEVGATGETPEEVAAIILAMAEQWKQLGPYTEALRIQGKATVRKCENVAAVNDALAAIQWPQVG